MSRICNNCGSQLNDDNSNFCRNCGNKLNSKTYNKDLLLVSKIFMIISCVSIGWTIIPLAWLIPMTIKISNREKNNTKLSTAFKVCTLLFGNTLSGILLLCDEEI